MISQLDNVEKDENELVSIKSDKNINISNDNGIEVTETGLEKGPIEQPEALELPGTTKQEVESLTDENSTIINGQTVDVTGYLNNITFLFDIQIDLKTLEHVNSMAFHKHELDGLRSPNSS